MLDGGVECHAPQRCDKKSYKTQQTRHTHPLLDQCWASVVDAGPALTQQWMNGWLVNTTYLRGKTYQSENCTLQRARPLTHSQAKIRYGRRWVDARLTAVTLAQHCPAWGPCFILIFVRHNWTVWCILHVFVCRCCSAGNLMDAQQARDIDPMLGQCWVVEDGPELCRHVHRYLFKNPPYHKSITFLPIIKSLSHCPEFGSMVYLNPFSAGTDFRRQNLTSTDVRFRRLKSISALK